MKNKLTKKFIEQTHISDNEIILKHLKLLKYQLEMQLKELNYIIEQQEELQHGNT